MPNQSPIFSQVTATLFHPEFSRCVRLFPTTRQTKGLTEYDQFLALCFGQLTYRESLRDIVICLKSKKALQYHLGFRGKITRTNLAYANRNRDWRLFQAVAEILMRRAARLYADSPFDPDAPPMAFALDSSIISLSLKMFPWGFYARSKQAALKLHLMLALQGQVPAWAAITEAHFPDMKILDRLPIHPGSFYIMDRGYLDFVRLYRIDQAQGFFVVRSKKHVKFSLVESRPVAKEQNLRADQTVRLKSAWSKKKFPRPLRRVTVYDPEHKIFLVLLTNNFQLPAQVIAELYRRRWQVELFFKWIKQHLRIRSFYGRSENAVRCQIWSAICTYLMVAILKKELGIPKTLYEILQIISVNAFEQIPLAELLAENEPIAEQGDCQKLFMFNH
jgi:hypothetical protein